MTNASVPAAPSLGHIIAYWSRTIGYWATTLLAPCRRQCAESPACHLTSANVQSSLHVGPRRSACRQIR
jgi:hypothetical protein